MERVKFLNSSTFSCMSGSCCCEEVIETFSCIRGSVCCDEVIETFSFFRFGTTVILNSDSPLDKLLSEQLELVHLLFLR